MCSCRDQISSDREPEAKNSCLGWGSFLYTVILFGEINPILYRDTQILVKLHFGANKITDYSCRHRKLDCQQQDYIARFTFQASILAEVIKTPHHLSLLDADLYRKNKAHFAHCSRHFKLCFEAKSSPIIELSTHAQKGG